MSALRLAGRSREDELMDSEATDYETFRGCLVDLERVNRASFGYRPTLSWLDRAAAGRSALRIVDVGCGHGDMLRRVWHWGRQRGIALDLVGVDLNPWARRAAMEATPHGMGISYETSDLFDIGPERRFDIILSALFAHHLRDEALVRFVRWMERTAQVGWFVNDLHRHWLPEWGLRTIFGALPVHRFVRHDGPVSVRRAFTRPDLRAVLDAAGVAPGRARIDWYFPYRWGVGTVPGWGPV